MKEQLCTICNLNLSGHEFRIEEGMFTQHEFTIEQKKSYEELEQEFVDIAQEMLNRFGINKADLNDVLDDQCNEED